MEQNQEEKIKYSMTPKEKKEMEEKKKLNELMVELIKEQRENNAKVRPQRTAIC